LCACGPKMCTHNQEHKLVCERPGRKRKKTHSDFKALVTDNLCEPAQTYHVNKQCPFTKIRLWEERATVRAKYVFLRIETVFISLTSFLLYEDTAPKQPWIGVRPAIRVQLASNLECKGFLHVFGSCHAVCVYMGPAGLVAPLIVRYNAFQLKCHPPKNREKRSCRALVSSKISRCFQIFVQGKFE